MRHYFVLRGVLSVPSVLSELSALLVVCSGAVNAQPATSGVGQSYPAKSIRLIVPLPPGGGNDTIARLIGQKITPALGQQVVVDNRAGAGGLIAAELVARSPADGYTLLLANVAVMTIIPNAQKKVPYDALKDFAPVSLIASAPLLVVVHPSLPVQSIKQLVALAKAKPDALNYASNGIGSSTHLATEMFSMMAGVKMVHVPYKGLSLAMTDLLSGQVPLMFSSAVAMLPHVKNNKLRAIAMTGAKRAPVMPDVPTVAEAGVKGYESGSWYGIVAPANTPRPIIERLNKEIVAVVKSNEIQERLVKEAVIPSGNSPDEFSAYIKAEFERMARVIREAKIVLD
jgi:tripartite-type tricarboxylate transporter receptor subunit TctC